jgi:hypothetical protein
VIPIAGREYLSEGRFEAAREQWRLALQTVRIPWYGKRRILLTAANSYILEGRYREAAVLCRCALLCVYLWGKKKLFFDTYVCFSKNFS